MKQEKKKLKKGYEAWPEEQQKTMQLGINVVKQKRDEFLQELQTEKIGLEEMDKEVQLNVENAALAVKAAKMGLASLLLDQKLGITINKHKNKVGELESDLRMHNHNIKHFQKQLDDGRPKPEKEKPESKPTPEPTITPEEEKKVNEARKKGAEELKKVEEEKKQSVGVDQAKGSDKTVTTKIEQTCIGCGCTENDCHQCIEKTGNPCSWVAPNKCSACFDEEGKLLEKE